MLGVFVMLMKPCLGDTTDGFRTVKAGHQKDLACEETVGNSREGEWVLEIESITQRKISSIIPLSETPIKTQQQGSF